MARASSLGPSSRPLRFGMVPPLDDDADARKKHARPRRATPVLPTRPDSSRGSSAAADSAAIGPASKVGIDWGGKSDDRPSPAGRSGSHARRRRRRPLQRVAPRSSRAGVTSPARPDSTTISCGGDAGARDVPVISPPAIMSASPRLRRRGPRAPNHTIRPAGGATAVNFLTSPGCVHGDRQTRSLRARPRAPGRTASIQPTGRRRRTRATGESRVCSSCFSLTSCGSGVDAPHGVEVMIEP